MSVSPGIGLHVGWWLGRCEDAKFCVSTKFGYSVYLLFIGLVFARHEAISQAVGVRLMGVGIGGVVFMICDSFWYKGGAGIGFVQIGNL